MLLVRNRAALVIMNDCKYVVPGNLEGAHNAAFSPRALPLFFSPSVRSLFSAGQPRGGGEVSYSFDPVSFPASVSRIGYSSEFSPVSAPFLFHRYDTDFPADREIGPRYFYLRSMRYERATRSRLFPRNSVSRSVRVCSSLKKEGRDGGEYKLYTQSVSRIVLCGRGRGTNDTSREQEGGN